jgi:aryl-alcohol dehydrogenase-like predicted oxidoreductase
VERIEAMATRKQCTPAQLALAWLLAHPDVVPIPGSKQRSRVEENAKAIDVRLTPAEMGELDDSIPIGAAAGTRYAAGGMASVHR